MSTGDWLRAEFLTDDADGLAAFLQHKGALGVEVQDQETFMEGADFPPVPDGKARVIAYFDDTADAPTLEAALTSLKGGQLQSFGAYSDRTWETAWMDYFKPQLISPRVAVGPPWDPPTAPASGIALTIEPGMAFGTGTHETTGLCAVLIDDLLKSRDVDDLLDVGCGSAILSMLASGLGVPRVAGIDIDAVAVGVAKENIEKNGFTEEEIQLSTTPLAGVPGDFDVVVANILAHILIALAPDLLARVRPGGELILSGIDEQRLDAVREAFASPEFDEVLCQQRGEWFALQLRRTEGEGE